MLLPRDASRESNRIRNLSVAVLKAQHGSSAALPYSVGSCVLLGGFVVSLSNDIVASLASRWRPVTVGRMQYWQKGTATSNRRMQGVAKQKAETLRMTKILDWFLGFLSCILIVMPAALGVLYIREFGVSVPHGDAMSVVPFSTSGPLARCRRLTFGINTTRTGCFFPRSSTFCWVASPGTTM